MLANPKGVVHNPNLGRRLKYWVDDDDKETRMVHEVPNSPFWKRLLKGNNVVQCTKEGGPLRTEERIKRSPDGTLPGTEDKKKSLPDMGDKKKKK
jgi:hypothetical protein